MTKFTTVVDTFQNHLPVTRSVVSGNERMNRSWEKVVLLVIGGLLFCVLDRLVVTRMSRAVTPEVTPITERSYRPYQNPQTSALVIESFPKPDLKPTRETGNEQVLDQTPSKGKTLVFSHDGDKLVRLHEFCTWAVRVNCVMLKTQGGPTPIHIHDTKWDKYVSGYILKSGTWEHSKMDLVMSELQKNSEFGFLDLGSHVGAYSLNAAKLGRKVVSVDPLIENVQRLCKSIQKGGFTDQMRIVFNPLSDSHTQVKFSTISDNIGATTITSSAINKTHTPCDDIHEHPTVMLDDIIPLVPFKKAVMKMDVEEHEFHVVNGGKKFFKEIDVAVIFMEWGRVKKLADEAQKLIAILTEFSYKAYEPVENGKLLDPELFAKWPFDVLWRKS